MGAPLFAGDGRETDEPDQARQPRHLSVVGEGPGQGDDRQLTVLLVEDDPAMQLLCTYNLEAAGFRVVSARSGREGLGMAAAESPDLVLLDVMLPDLGGFDVAQRLGTVPIVFLSARTSDDDLERGRAAGAIDYITKPFDPVALPDRLREDLDELRQGGSADRVWTMRFGPHQKSRE
ncbi:MAG TPA: response regulator [Gaiellaceae bacterium]|jgi:DNA-binding response OmpR family regulator